MNSRIKNVLVILSLGAALMSVSCTTLEKSGISSGKTAAPYSIEALDSFEEVYAAMKPLEAAPDAMPVDAEGLRNKVFTGYQGWFGPKGDGGGVDWMHYGLPKKGQKGRVFEPGSSAVEMWPSTEGAGETELYPTVFRHRNGSVAHVVSSLHPDTVDRHFRWMKDYNFDGAFLQRFGVALKQPNRYHTRNLVLDNLRRSAQRHGRAYAVMYDLSGLQAGDIKRVVMEDWKRLSRDMKVTEEKNYLTLGGKPLVSIWGVGFGDAGRRYSLEECRELVEFLKNDPEFGGCAVMLGIPYYWREQIRDSMKDADTHSVFAMADVLSPWAVGRYKTPKQAAAQVDNYKKDLAWCEERGIEYFPVAYPGFSWGNLKAGRGDAPKFNQIPRLEGMFLWSQFETLAKAGVQTVYLAMFDEIDEGTCFFKVDMNPPVGETRFLDYGVVEDDHYMWLASEGRKLLRKETKVSGELPVR